MPAIYHEGSWLGNATDPEVLVKDTVGWTGKNLLKNTMTPGTAAGVTYTVNSDGSITVNGTGGSGDSTRGFNLGQLPIGIYILTGCPSDGGSIKYDMRLGTSNDPTSTWGTYVGLDSGEGLSFEVSDSSLYYSLALRIYAGYTASNLTFYPMIRRVDITDPTYEPYHESVEEYAFPASAQGVLGAKNLLPKFSSGTDHGITYTVDGDGVVTGNGTASDNNSTIGVKVSLKAGSYILSGCPSGGSTNTYRINAYLSTSPYTNYGNDTGEGLALSFTTDTTIMVQIVVKNGASISNLTFKPMLRLASDPDDTYQPYAMTNRELTENRYYHAGDTVNVSLMNFAGLITNNSKDIRFTIPLMRDLSKITGITFKNTTTVGIRKPGGGYVIDGAISSGYTIAILAKAGNLLSLKLTKTDDSAFDATNNTPLDVAFTGGSNDSAITFS